MIARIGVVAHQSRADQAWDLANTVNADYLSIDDGSLGCDGNHDHVLTKLAQHSSTWAVVLEDDAVPVEMFTPQLQQALIVAPTPIVSLYLGRKRPPGTWQARIRPAIAKATAEDASWIIGTHLLHAVGYAIKTNLVPSLLAHTTELAVDQHISNWARSFGHLISYTFPSLVDHADGPTIAHHPDGEPRTPGRKAWNTGTRTLWTTKAVTL